MEEDEKTLYGGSDGGFEGSENGGRSGAADTDDQPTNPVNPTPDNPSGLYELLPTDILAESMEKINDNFRYLEDYIRSIAQNIDRRLNNLNM